MLAQHIAQRRGAARMDAGDGDGPFLRLLRDAQRHLVRDGADEQDKQVRRPQLLPQRAVFLGEYLCLTAVLTAVLSYWASILSFPPTITTLIRLPCLSNSIVE